MTMLVTDVGLRLGWTTDLVVTLCLYVQETLANRNALLEKFLAMQQQQQQACCPALCGCNSWSGSYRLLFCLCFMGIF